MAYSSPAACVASELVSKHYRKTMFGYCFFISWYREIMLVLRAVWMLPNLSKPQVSLLTKVRRSNRVSQVSHFLLS
jgi:hypothetical protein